MQINDFVLKKEELDKVDFSIFSNTPITFHEHEIRDHLQDLSNRENGINNKKTAQFLSLLFNYNLPSGNGTPNFEPQFIFDNKRSALPEDFEIDYLLDLSDRIDNPFLLSRICDTVWCNSKRNREIAIKAVDSYALMIREAVNIITGVKENIKEENLNHLLFIKPFISRALFINKTIYSRKSKGNENLSEAICFLYSEQNERKIFEGFDYLTAIMINSYPRERHIEYAENAESMANYHRGTKYFDAVKALLNTAAKIYEKNDDRTSAKRCRLSAAYLTIEVANARSDNMGKVSWLRTAIEELRQAGGDQDQINELKHQLADLRRESLDDYVTFSAPLDIAPIVESITNELTNTSISEIFKTVIANTPLENINKMRKQVQKTAAHSIFSNLASTEIHDEEGRRVHRIPPLNNNNALSDDSVIDSYMRHININHAIFINGYFEPARDILLKEHSLSMSTFYNFVSNSIVIKEDSEQIFALGFYRLWQGDYISASYLLIPQMENILRHYYQLSGKDATRYLDKGLEESTSISVLLDKCREDLIAIFNEDIVLTVDLIFNRKGGPILRHSLAHGNLHAGACFAETTIYACVLIFSICAYPLLPHLDEIFHP
ncbi:DUF7380 domain-containing protein [Kosakonia cowanii]